MARGTVSTTALKLLLVVFDHENQITQSHFLVKYIYLQSNVVQYCYNTKKK